MDDNQFLEQFYEGVIIPRYSESIPKDRIEWIDHGNVGLDAWAHHFRVSGKEYTLLYEDFPDGSYFQDDPTHELVKCSNEMSIELRFSDDTVQVPNIIGWFTLFREK
jgi:hypothetical protein